LIIPSIATALALCGKRPQGAVAQFVRIVTKILQGLIPKDCWPVVDDTGVKGPYTVYENEEVRPGVRRYIMEHTQSLDRTLERLERAGPTIAQSRSSV
jgi:hypothetical protein